VKSIRIHEHGGIDVLQWEDISTPVPGPRQVLINIKAGALNHLDLWVRNGIPGVPLPIILGSDGSGIVADKGDEVTGFKSGDEVMVQPLVFCGECQQCIRGQENLCATMGILGESCDGTFAEKIILPENQLVQKPDFLSFEEAAAFPLVAQTAYQMLVKKARIKPDDWVLIWGASSGVGSIAVQIAKAKGARVIAVSSSDKKLDKVKALGADITVDRTNQEVLKIVKKTTDGRGADIVFEHVGQATWTISMRSLARGGRLVTCGATTGPKADLNLTHLFFKQQSVLGSTMGSQAALKEAMDLLRQKKIKPVVDRVFPMAEVKYAHEYLESEGQFGKVILRCE